MPSLKKLIAETRSLLEKTEFRSVEASQASGETQGPEGRTAWHETTVARQKNRRRKRVSISGVKAPGKAPKVSVRIRSK